jgi:hypothetical protein
MTEKQDMLKRCTGCISLILILITAVAANGEAVTSPELPRVYMDVVYSEPQGSIIRIPAGGDLQSALNNAEPGDIIELEAGATFTGNFTLPEKNNPNNEWIVIRTSAYGSLAPEGTRIDPSYSGFMPKLVSNQSLAVIQADDRASYYRFIGIEACIDVSYTTWAVMRLGDPHLTAHRDQPHHIIIDRCYIHGFENSQLRRGVEFQGSYMAVIDSYLSNIRHGSEPQAIGGWNGPGPYKIVNNFLEASGENIMFGGAGIKVPNNIPSDIEIRRNHIFKRLSWRGDSSGTLNVKNLFELKNAQRVFVDGNIFENCWGANQRGYAINFTPRSESGAHRWVRVQDITFTNNIIKNVNIGMLLAAADYSKGWVDEPTHRVKIENNVFENISRTWGYNPNDPSSGDGWAFLWSSYTHDIIVNHNTMFMDGAGGWGSPVVLRDDYVMTNNIWTRGIDGDSAAQGDGHPQIKDGSSGALNTHFSGVLFEKNVLAGVDSKYYLIHTDNYFPASVESDVGFKDYNGGDYRLSDTSPYRNAGSDGKDIGADIDAIEAAIGGSNPVPPYLRGDVKGDNRLDLLDIQACLNHILGKQDLGEAADVKKDGRVDVRDLQEIVNIILHLASK